MTMDDPIIRRILEAIIRKIEGVKGDIKRQLDYLINPENLRTMSRLSEEQVQAVNECVWIGEAFPQFEGLKLLGLGLAWWRISLEGKGREEVTSTMLKVSEKEIAEGLGIHVHTPEIVATEGKKEGKKK